MWRVALLITGVVWAAEDLTSVERLLANGQFNAALQTLESISGRSFRWHLLASQASEGINEPARAVTEAEAALAIEPANEAAHLRLGQIFLSHNTPSAALEIFTDAQQTFPQSFLIRLGKGLALKELQRYEDAITAFRMCLAQNPSSGIAFDGLGSSLLNSASYEALAKEAESFKAQNPDDFRGYYYLAAGRDGLRMPDDISRRLLRESLRINPNFAASYSLLGKILLRQNSAAEAAKALERAIALRPDHVASHMHLANAYRALGRKDDAAREHQIVRDLNEKGQQPKPSLIYHRGSR